ncbi:MAG TPA: tetratricopeptide repeat protein [Streptosporangiaceae bacterium]
MSLRLVRALIEAGETERAGQLLGELALSNPDDWRIDWYRGIAGLASGRLDLARDSFDAVYGLLPGEVAPNWRSR